MLKVRDQNLTDPSGVSAPFMAAFRLTSAQRPQYTPEFDTCETQKACKSLQIEGCRLLHLVEKVRNITYISLSSEFFSSV